MNYSMRVSKAARGPQGGKLINGDFESEKMRASAEGTAVTREFVRDAQRRPSASMCTPKKSIESLGRGHYIEKKFGVARNSGAVWYRGVLKRQQRGFGVSIWEVTESQICNTIGLILV